MTCGFPHKGPVIWTICLLTCLPEGAAEQSVKLPMTRDRDAIAPMWRQCYGFGKSNDSIQKTLCRKSRWRHQIEVLSAGLLCGELTGHRWIPHAKASDAELWCFLWINNGDAGDLRRHRAHFDVSVMVSKAFYHYMHYNPRFVRFVQVVEINH